MQMVGICLAWEVFRVPRRKPAMRAVDLELWPLTMLTVLTRKTALRFDGYPCAASSTSAVLRVQTTGYVTAN